MRTGLKVLLIAFIVTAVVAGGVLLWLRLTEVSAEELEAAVRRDGAASGSLDVPDEVLDRLADHRVVLVGEIHFLREHRELTAELIRQLHARGFRQFLFEWAQAADWLLSDYVNDGGVMPGWEPPHDIGGVTLTAIRDFNRSLPENERIQVHGIDITLQDYGGAPAWLYLLSTYAGTLSEPGPIPAFVQADHSTAANHRLQLEQFQQDLAAGKTELVDAWGADAYDRVAEMVAVELDAVEVRALRESDYDQSVRLREDAIKRIVDRRIDTEPGGTLINVGATHAQKEQLWGTDIEWLGEYLVHASPAADGSVTVLWVSAAHIIADPESGIPDYDLSASPENELLRTMNQVWPDQVVYLPVDDPIFSGGRVALNADQVIYRTPPKHHFDWYVLLPEAHRDFVGD